MCEYKETKRAWHLLKDAHRAGENGKPVKSDILKKRAMLILKREFAPGRILSFNKYCPLIKAKDFSKWIVLVSCFGTDAQSGSQFMRAKTFYNNAFVAKKYHTSIRVLRAIEELDDGNEFTARVQLVDAYRRNKTFDISQYSDGTTYWLQMEVELRIISVTPLKE